MGEKPGTKPGTAKGVSINRKLDPPVQVGDLSPSAERYWSHLSDELTKINVVSEIDSVALQILADAFAEYEEAKRMIEEEGSVITQGIGMNTRRVKNPWVQIRDDHRKTILRLSTQFGMTPASRKAIEKLASDWLDGMPDAEHSQSDNPPIELAQYA